MVHVYVEKKTNRMNPLCRNPVHDAVGNRSRTWFRQRHTCVQCCLDRVGRLVEKMGIDNKYAIVKTINREFRSYWCPFCLLDADLVNITKCNLRAHCSVHKVSMYLLRLFSTPNIIPCSHCERKNAAMRMVDAGQIAVCVKTSGLGPRFVPVV